MSDKSECGSGPVCGNAVEFDRVATKLFTLCATNVVGGPDRKQHFAIVRVRFDLSGTLLLRVGEYLFIVMRRPHSQTQSKK